VTQTGVALVLDEHIMAGRAAMRQRGIDTRTVEDFNATSTLDPDVIRLIAAAMDCPWVLVTMDGSIVDDHPAFEWERYAIAWLTIDRYLKGAAVEFAKMDTLHRRAHQMLEQRPGDHHTYTRRSRYRCPPSLVSRQRAFGRTRATVSRSA